MSNYNNAKMIRFLDGLIIFDYTFVKHPVPNDCEQAKARGTFICGMVANFKIDVNGLKKTNIVGRDIFYLIIANTGDVYPKGGVVDSNNQSDNVNTYWKTYNGVNTCMDNGSSLGYGCAARIMESGWIMDY